MLCNSPKEYSEYTESERNEGGCELGHSRTVGYAFFDVRLFISLCWHSFADRQSNICNAKYEGDMKKEIVSGIGGKTLKFQQTKFP